MGDWMFPMKDYGDIDAQIDAALAEDIEDVPRLLRERKKILIERILENPKAQL